MDIKGLNSFMPMQPQASGSGKATKSSFEDVLGNQSKKSESQEAKKDQPQDAARYAGKAGFVKAQPKQAPKLANKFSSKPKEKDTKQEDGTYAQNDQVAKDQSNMDQAAPKDSNIEDVKVEGRETQGRVQGGQVQKDAKAENVDPNALPGGQPSMPTLGTPISDRVIDGPMEPVGLAPQGGKIPGLLEGQDEGVDSLTRRVVWNDFFRKMNDELGLSIEDVLGAFSELSDADLNAPAQQSVNKVVMSLGLVGQDAALAKQYFGELMQKTKSKSMGEELSASQRQINLTLMSQREMQRKAMNQAVDAMSGKFFVDNQQVAKDKKDGATPNMIPLAASERAFDASAMQAQTATAAPLANDPMSVPLAQNKIIAKGALTPGDIAAMQSDPIYSQKSIEQKNTVDELVKQFMVPQAKPQMLAAGEAAAAAPAAPAAATAAPAASTAVAPAAGLNALLADLSRGDDSDDDGGDYSSDASYLQQNIGAGSKYAGLAGASASEFKAELANLNQNQQPVAVPELVDRAQLMVHAGGGEMKVTLSPDGLGEVAMRVAVNDGKVSVQMITESDEAKKMIERQLHELKAGLGQNHLQVDSIKVDTATNLGKQLEQQYQDAQRQSTSQAWEQFRQETGGWKRSFFETPSARNYRSQGDAPRDVSAPTTNTRRVKNSRLDLVA